MKKEIEMIEELLEKAKNNNRGATGKLLSRIEYPTKQAGIILKKLMEKSGKAHVIGVTGVPGSGKSTLISQLITQYRRMEKKIAVIAVDPTSPLSSGSLMADRLRMQAHSTDPFVFIRSLASKGYKGGLSLAALAMIEALDGLGYDKIIVETVGVGQADVDIMNVAHTIVVVTMPGVGDDIQALKAGVMEIGDIYVVNKSDKQEAEQTMEFINFALETGSIGSTSGWKTRLLKTIAIQGIGIEELVKALEDHFKYLRETANFQKKIDERRLMLAKTFTLRAMEERIEQIIEKERNNILKIFLEAEDPYEEINKLFLKQLY